MAEHEDPISQPTPVPDPAAAEPQATPQPPPPKRKRGRIWWKIVVAFVLFIVILLALAPTLAGTGPVRNLILGAVNKNLNGKVEVADLSASWTRGISVDGLKVRDEKGEVVLQASRARTQLSLWRALRSGFSKFHLGRTEVENLDLTKFHIDEEGVPNYARLAKESKPKKEPGAIEVTGDFVVTNLTGTVTAANLPQNKVYIRPSSMSATVAGINDPIKHDVKLVFAVDNSPPGTLTSVGEIDLLDNGKVNQKTAKMKQRLGLAGVDLSVANPLFAMAKNDLKLAGVADGSLDISLAGLANVGATGELKIAKFEARGGPLKGDDVFRSNLQVPVKITRVTENGVDLIKIEDTRIVTDYGTVTVKADAAQDALERLARNQAPGREGSFALVVDFKDAAKLVTSLRSTLELVSGVEVNSGRVWAQVDASILKDRLVGKSQFAVENVAGVKKDAKTGQTQNIALSPIKHSMNLTYVPSADSVGQIRDVALAFESAFLNLKGGTGPQGTLARFDLSGDGDLAKLQQELGQFRDMGDLKLGGKLKIAANTNGDPTKGDVPVATTVDVTVTELSVAGLANKPPIHQPWLKFIATGDLHLKNNAPTQITRGEVKLQSNNPNQPTVDVLAKGNLDLRTLTSDQFKLEKLAIDLAKARGEFAAFFPALSNFTSGTITASGAGTYDGKSFVLAPQTPLRVVGQNISMRLPADQSRPRPVDVLRDRSLEMTLAGALRMLPKEFSLRAESLAVTSPNLLEVKTTGGPLAVTYQSDARKIQGTGTVSVFADVKQVNDILKAMQPPPAPAADGAAPEPQPEKIAQLTKGLLRGTLALARTNEPTTSVKGDFTMDVELTTQQKEPLVDKVAVVLNAAVPDDMAQEAKGSLDLKSNYATVNVADLVAVTANDGLDMLRRANVTVNAPRLDAVQAIVDALMPPSSGAPAPVPQIIADVRPGPDDAGARQARFEVDDEAFAAGADKPLPPLRVERGALAFKSEVVREGAVTHLRNAGATIDNLRLRRGEGVFQADKEPITFNLAADLETLGKQLRSIRFTRLDGNLGVARLGMPKPIMISDLGGTAAKPSANGAIEVKGDIDRTLRLLEALAGAKPYSKYPYAGDFVLTQDVTTQDQKIRLAGRLDASNFRALDPKDPRKATFTEDQFAVANDIAADFDTDTVTIHNFLVDMKSSGALRLAISNGQLVDWRGQRKIADTLTARLRVDWPKLWEVVRPMLDPETLESLDDLRLAGTMERDFTVRGAFPAEGVNRRGKKVSLPFQASVKRLYATGGLSIPQVYVSGLEFRDAFIPVILHEGVVLVQDASKPKGKERIPEPIACNGGYFDVGGIKLDLTWIDPKNPKAITPLLTIPDRNHAIAKNVNMNKFLAESALGNYVNPVFSDSKEASGALDLASVYCDRLPLGAVMKSPQSPGSAQFVLSMSKVQVQGEGLSRVTGGIALAMNQIVRLINKDNSSRTAFEGIDSITGAIRDSVITIERGRISHRLVLETDRFGVWSFDGTLNIASKEYSALNVKVPTTLFGRNNDLAKFLGETITFPFAGPIKRPSIAPDFVGKFVQENVVKGLGRGALEGILKPKEGGGSLLEGILKPQDRQRGAPGDERIDRDPRDMPPERRDERRGAEGDRRSDAGGGGVGGGTDSLGGWVDLADQLLGEGAFGDAARPAGQSQAPSRGREVARDRDVGNERISGDERISSDRAGATGGERVSGDERISSGPGGRRPATQPAPAPARSNRRNRDR